MVRKRKLWTRLSVAGAMLFALASVGFSAEHAAVIVNGKTIELDGPIVRIGVGHVLLPAESYLRGLGAKVTWDATTQQVTALKGQVRMIMVIGQNFAVVNGVQMPLTMPAQTLSGKPYVPVRPCAEAFGMEVAWDAATLSATITTKTQPAEGRTVKGTLLGAKGAALLVRQVEDGANVAYPVSGNVKVFRGLAGSKLQQIPLGGLQPGDLLELSLDANDRVTAISATYAEVSGTLEAISSNYLLLKEGSFHPIAQGAQVVTEQGQPTSLYALGKGTKVTLRVNPSNNEVWGLTVTSTAGVQPAQPTGPPQVVAFTTPGYVKPLKAGDSLQIQLVGTPGCQAEVTLGEGGATIAMTEGPAGTYESSLAVQDGMDAANLRLAGRLVRGNEQSEFAYSDAAITIDTQVPKFSNALPQRGSTIPNASPTISVKYEDRGASGVDQTSVKILVDNTDMTDRAQIDPTQALLPTDNLAAGEHKVHIEVADLAGNANAIEWSFFVAPAAGGQIRSVRHDATAPLTAGDTLTVTMTTRAPGQQATFDIGGFKTGLPMQLNPAGATYVGTYLVGQNDRVTGALVICHFKAADGTEHTLAATNPVTFTPQLPTALAIRSPQQGETTGRHKAFSGVAPPRARVRYILSWEKAVFGGELTRGLLNADDNGNWQTEAIDLKIPLLKMAEKYTLVCETLDANDQVIDQQQVVFHARE